MAGSSDHTGSTDKPLRNSRPCDTCRKRRVKCDKNAKPGQTCHSCKLDSLTCTWEDTVKKRGRKHRADALESRLQALEEMLARFLARSEPDSSNRISDDSSSNESTLADDEQETELLPLSFRLCRLELNAIVASGSLGATHLADRRFAECVVGEEVPEYRYPTSALGDPWEETIARKWARDGASCIFPSPDLLPVLVAAYFDNVNLYAPLLHRPSFEAAVAAELHRDDRDFAAVLLTTCALGARFVDDPRARIPAGIFGTANVRIERSAGWVWYSQVDLTHRDVLLPPTLYFVQAHLLSAMFTRGSFDGRMTWMAVGTALRCMQELGMDRRKTYTRLPRAEAELWKRCFWLGLHLDLSTAVEMERSCLLTHGQFDVDLPLECDDASWDHPESTRTFQQSTGQLSLIVFFNHVNNLRLIHLRAMQILSAVETKLRERRNALAEIETALEVWLKDTPTHLRWESTPQNRPQDDIFFCQAAQLWLAYNHLLISIHRPFIALQKHPDQTPESTRALGVCTDAAYEISNLLGIAQVLASAMTALPPSMVYANSAAVVFLSRTFAARQLGIEVDRERVQGGLEKCAAALLLSAHYYRSAEHLHKRLVLAATRAMIDLSPKRNQANSGESSNFVNELRPVDSQPISEINSAAGQLARAVEGHNDVFSSADAFSGTGGIFTPTREHAPLPASDRPASGSRPDGGASSSEGDAIMFDAGIFTASHGWFDTEDQWASDFLMREWPRLPGEDVNSLFDPTM